MPIEMVRRDPGRRGAGDPPAVPAGQWVAWSSDGLRIVARRRPSEEAERLAAEAGEPEPILEIPPVTGSALMNPGAIVGRSRTGARMPLDLGFLILLAIVAAGLGFRLLAGFGGPRIIRRRLGPGVARWDWGAWRSGSSGWPRSDG